MDNQSTSASSTSTATILPLFEASQQKPKFPWWTALRLTVATCALLGLVVRRTSTMPPHQPPHHRRALASSSSSTAAPATTDTAAPATTGLDQGFVTRKGDKLMLNGSEFRFNSWNVPGLHIVEDDKWHPVHPFEQEDALQAVTRMGGQVVRIYPLSIAGGYNNGSYTHILGPAEYNERLFRDMDSMLALANKYGVRIIIPFIDNWEWWGGIRQFCSFFSVNFREFYRDDKVKLGFKAYVRHVLLRRNTVTGVLYKDDPAIMAWETGNELDYDDTGINPGLPTSAEMDAWVKDLAAYIKSLDPNHLVIDGRQLRNRDISPAMLQDPHVDIITDHFYPNLPFSFSDRLQHMATFTQGKKPFMVGEFGLVMPETLETLLVTMLATKGVCGGLMWSLRSHSRTGGFYWHYEYDNYWAYHYPGFDSNEIGGERAVLKMMTKYAYAIQDKDIPPEQPPTQPSIIPTSTSDQIAWRGSVGAETYVLQRSSVTTTDPTTDGDKQQEQVTWATVATGLLDSSRPFVPYADTSAEPGVTYYYRIVAINSAGQSMPSEAVQLHSSSSNNTV